MNKDTFSALPASKRCDLVFEEGQFIDTIPYYKYKANLYALNTFFVEVLCFHDSATVQRIEVATEDHLHKYLNRIDVSTIGQA